jgi:hypothetical protein
VKGRILDCRTTGWLRKHAVRALRRRGVEETAKTRDPRERKRRYGVTIKDALTALWEASERVCGKRLVAMIPTLLPALEQHGRLQLSEGEQAQLLAVSAATIDRMLGDVKIAAAGGRRRRAGFYSAIRREVPIRTFNDWKDPAPGFCEVDMVAHGGTSVAGSFIQTLTMVVSRAEARGDTIASLVGRLANPRPAAKLRHRHTVSTLLENERLLGVRKPRCLHRSPLLPARGNHRGKTLAARASSRQNYRNRSRDTDLSGLSDRVMRLVGPGSRPPRRPGAAAPFRPGSSSPQNRLAARPWRYLSPKANRRA